MFVLFVLHHLQHMLITVVDKKHFILLFSYLSTTNLAIETFHSESPTNTEIRYVFVFVASLLTFKSNLLLLI